MTRFEKIAAEISVNPKSITRGPLEDLIIKALEDERERCAMVAQDYGYKHVANSIRDDEVL
jgi:hypothetical protein